ncbi:hypothetical protein, partial [Cellulomonas shaoxiangyii]
MDDTRDPRHDAPDDAATGSDGPDTADAVAAGADPATADAATADATTAAAAEEAATEAAAKAEDAALARVRAADPAAGATPDLPRLHARLTDATGVAVGVTTGGPTGATTGGPAPSAPDELAAARARRRPARWLQVAAVATGAVLVGGGGY